MERSVTLVLLILLSICINVSAQLLLKVGMARIGHFEFAPENIWPIGWKVATSLPVIAGLALYVASVTVWLLVLSRAEVGFAYPMGSLGYLLTALAGWWLLGETMSWLRFSGIVCIIFGVFLVAKTA